ncbi:Sm-like ribonucleo protein [Sodiomyces alkalinus F11]|uniref:U6 snRNA-associated Sm-like protein LSm1 n=1 Tax=Sodiomyces alkalinus (strain CBS 110278 / VKM F-3762 / F11) TaxID=1314773 RepID=A0A3N2Q0G6_SODAK|nr:Sm-like ribonucleo protein [Sodiomyces alkalinus F11]ROT40257.1 Sm-like ribonucleo protein [Sodiomyces alkalinus F11]
MENPSIAHAQPHQHQQQGPQGQPVLGRGAAPLATPPAQQLPPQMFTTAAQLLDLTDKKLMVALRDGRKLIGVLRSWDQFANLVLQNTVERIFAHPNPSAGGLYADIDRGVFLVRGENVLLLGEIDLDKDDDPPAGYELAEPELVHRLAEEQKDKDKVKDRARLRKLASIGFEGENIGEVLL